MTSYKQLLQLMLLATTFVILSGCVSTTTQKSSGFLVNYDGFVDSKTYDNTKVYQADGFGKNTIAELKEIKLVPFEIWITPDEKANFNPQQLTDSSQYFHQKMKANLLRNHYNVVDKVGNNTLTIQGAFSSVNFEEPELEATDFIPFRIMLNAGNEVYLQVTDAQDVITKVLIEMEFLQGTAQKRVFALMATKAIDSTIANNGKDNMKAVQELLDHWADSFVEKLVAVRAVK
jgi:hypothetical protein